MEQSKRCSACSQILPYEAFGKIAKSSTGRRSACNKCRSIESRSYRQRYPEKKKLADKLYQQNNADKIKIRRQAYREANAEYIAAWHKAYREQNKEAIAEMKREWRKRNAEWADNASKRWQEANKDLVREYKRTYRKNNPDRDKSYYLANPAKFHANRVKRRAREASAIRYLVTNKDIRRIMSKPCIYCKAKSEHLDHVLPLAKGGYHGLGNLAGACAECNLSKGPKYVSEWRYL